MNCNFCFRPFVSYADVKLNFQYEGRTENLHAKCLANILTLPIYEQVVCRAGYSCVCKKEVTHDPLIVYRLSPRTGRSEYFRYMHRECFMNLVTQLDYDFLLDPHKFREERKPKLVDSVPEVAKPAKKRETGWYMMGYDSSTSSVSTNVITYTIR